MKEFFVIHLKWDKSKKRDCKRYFAKEFGITLGKLELGEKKDRWIFCLQPNCDPGGRCP